MTFRQNEDSTSADKLRDEKTEDAAASARITPQEIYNTLEKLHVHKAKENTNFIRTHRDLEITRNYFLKDALNQMKGKLNNTDENYNNAKAAIIKLLNNDINTTMKWYKDHDEKFKSGKDLGKMYRLCLELMPDAFITLLWQKTLHPDDRTYMKNVHEVLRDEFKGKSLKYDLPDKTKAYIKNNPLFQALSISPEGLSQQIIAEMASLKIRYENKEMGLEPINDTTLLKRLLVVLDNWILKREWDAPAYEQIKADIAATPLYAGTKNVVRAVTPYCDQISAILDMDKKPESPKPESSR